LERVKKGVNAIILQTNHTSFAENPVSEPLFGGIGGSESFNGDGDAGDVDKGIAESVDVLDESIFSDDDGGIGLF